MELNNFRREEKHTERTVLLGRSRERAEKSRQKIISGTMESSPTASWAFHQELLSLSVMNKLSGCFAWWIRGETANLVSDPWPDTNNRMDPKACKFVSSCLLTRKNLNSKESILLLRCLSLAKFKRLLKG
jgi:hypothetical protein